MITYRVIGKRFNLIAEQETACDEWLGVTMGEIPFGVALGVMPDGLVIEVDEDGVKRYFETSGARLQGIDPGAPGRMNTAKRGDKVVISRVDLWREIHEAGKEYRQMVNKKLFERLEGINGGNTQQTTAPARVEPRGDAAKIAPGAGMEYAGAGRLRGNQRSGNMLFRER